MMMSKNLLKEWIGLIGVLDIAPHSYCGKVCDWQIISNAKGYFKKEKKKKNYARTLYWHECEPVIQMLNTTNRVVA
jgi:hypothetical protein